MNRIDRVSAILIQLQSRRVVKAQDIAERFGISLRTVYRDIKTLEEAGVPLLGEAGVGYSIMEGYRLPPVMFTPEEATTFLTAEKLVAKFADTSTARQFKSAMYKVKAVMKSGEKDFLDNADGYIEIVRKHELHVDTALNNPVQQILKSISEKKVLQLHYFANHSQQHTVREVEPIGICFISGYWHLMAWCYLRHDYRDFRIDRIRQISETPKNFNKQHPTLKKYLEQLSAKQNLETIVIRTDKETARYMHNARYYFGFVNEKERKGQMEMTFLSPAPCEFLRWYMMFAHKAELISPASIKAQYREMISELFHQLKNMAL